MCSLLAESEFVEADVTYNETQGYPYFVQYVSIQLCYTGLGLSKSC